MLKEQLRRHLTQITPEVDLRRWFDALELFPLPDSLEIVVEYPHAYFAQWFESEIKDHFEKQVSLFLGPGYTLRYRYRSALRGEFPAAGPVLKPSNIDFPFGHEYTFEQFFTNQKNLLPLASAKEIAKTKEVRFNPFVVHGVAGTGKTHLLRCMANEVSKHQDKNFIFFGSLDDLADLYATGPQGGSPGSPSGALSTAVPVRAQLAGFRYFFLDDLHRLGEYPHLGSELLCLFNIFNDSKRQMTFSTARKISDCQDIPEPLKNRLEGGLVVQLAVPDLDVRVKYVQDHCQRKKLSLTKAQMLTLAQRYRELRGLTGVLNKFQAFRELLKRDISDAIFENILGRDEEQLSPQLTPEVIMEAVANRFQMDQREITGSKRHQNIVLARQVAMLLCREELGLSYPALGRLFGGKDHSTVLYSIKKIITLQANNKDMKELMAALRKTCHQKD